MDLAKAVLLPAPRDKIRLADVELGPPGPGEVRVAMRACGICHSDVMIAGLDKLPLAPLILGHEGVGVIEAVGEGVDGFARGDRVGITYLASSCGRCDACRSQQQRLCTRQLNHGYTRHGVLASGGIVAAQNLVRIPDTLSDAEAAPLCCAGWTALGALRQAHLSAGQLAAIFGFGGLGHLALQYARHFGFRTAVVDVGPEKLELARALGAGVATDPDGARALILKEMGGADAALVLTASSAAIPVAFSCLKRGGSLILAGLNGDRLALPVMETVLKGVRIQGSFLGSGADLEDALALAAQGIVKPTVSTYSLEDAPELIARLGRGEITGRAVVIFSTERT